MPIIVLSARESEAAKVAALDAGADDYVTKPFGMDELLARLRAALRRAAPGEEDAVVETPDFTIDLAGEARDAATASEVHLTPTEWQLVEVLVRNPGKLVTQRQLLQEVWGPQYDDETNYLRVYMAQVRRKLEPEPSQPALLHHRARHGLPLREPLSLTVAGCRGVTNVARGWMTVTIYGVCAVTFMMVMYTLEGGAAGTCSGPRWGASCRVSTGSCPGRGRSAWWS